MAPWGFDQFLKRDVENILYDDDLSLDFVVLICVCCVIGAFILGYVTNYIKRKVNTKRFRYENVGHSVEMDQI